MGHRSAANSRPILRLVLLFTGRILSLFSLALTAYFWYSRHLTIGIATSAHAIDTLVRVFAFGATVARRGGTMSWLLSPAVLFIAGLVWSLCARLEWVGGGPGEMLLVGVKRRRATKGERASAREDARFTWIMKAGVSDLLMYMLRYLAPC